MFQTNDDFLENLNFGSPDCFNYMNKIEKNDICATDIILKLAPVEDNKHFVSDLKGDKMTKKLTDFKHGTTTLGFVFKEGIIIAVDSRSTMGAYISSQQVKKVIEINSYILGTMAGGGADCYFWERRLGMWCQLYELKHGSKVPISAASECICNWISQYKGYGLSIGTMISGWIEEEPGLYYVDNDGTRIKGNIFSIGSGSTHAYGVLDSKLRYDMSLKEAIALGREAIYHATHRDCGSGGVVNLYHIYKNGWKRIIDQEDVYGIHEEKAKEKGLRGDGNETNQGVFGY